MRANSNDYRSSFTRTKPARISKFDEQEALVDEDIHWPRIEEALASRPL